MDEVTDRFNWEQLAVALRYVDAENYIQEKLMCFVPCEAVTGEALTDKLITLLDHWGLPIMDMRGQGYDGGSNMAGAVKGVQGRITAINEKAIYVHCAAHCLNLSIVKACQLPMVRNVMGTLQEICTFFNYSPKRQRVLEETILSEAPSSKIKLVDLCKTRWVERHQAFETFAELYELVLACMESISDTSRSWDSETLIKTKGFIACLTNFQFLVTFIITKNCLRYLKPVSVSIQQRAQDIIAAYEEIRTVKSCLQDMRDNAETYFSVMYEECKYVASRIDVDPKTPRQCSRQTKRCNTPATSPKEYCRRSVFMPFLDPLLVELENRFSTHSHMVANGLLLTPELVKKNETAVLPEGIKMLVAKYSHDLPEQTAVASEYHSWWRQWKAKEGPLPSTAQDSLKSCNKGFYPNLHTLLKILCTIPVTSAECERSISVFKRVKTYLRSTMTNEQLNGLALMNIHSTASVNIQEVIDTFAGR